MNEPHEDRMGTSEADTAGIDTAGIDTPGADTSKRRAMMVGGGIVGAVLVVLFSWWRMQPADGPVPVAPVDPTTVETPVVNEEPVPTAEYNVYFPGADERLHAEVRELPADLPPADRLVALVDLLLTGPLDTSLFAPLPAGTTAADAYLLDDGRIIIDLEPPLDEETGEPTSPPQVGTRGEILMAYSLANSLLLNLPEARGLTVLWQGRQPATFAGHLDATRPLSARPDLIREAPRTDP